MVGGPGGLVRNDEAMNSAFYQEILLENIHDLKINTGGFCSTINSSAQSGSGRIKFKSGFSPTVGRPEKFSSFSKTF